jgi:hypothetical protein
MARRRSRRSGRDEYWIQEAIKNPGALKRYVKRVFGEEGFTRRGTIKTEVLRELLRHPNETIRRRAQLALTLRRLRKR